MELYLEQVFNTDEARVRETLIPWYVTSNRRFHVGFMNYDDKFVEEDLGSVSELGNFDFIRDALEWAATAW